MLYGLAVFDELASGIGTVATPDIERSFGASHALATAVLFLVPGIAAFAIEPLIFILADRYPRRWFIRGGVAAMAVASALAAFARGPVLLSISISLLGIAIGASSSLAQATLVDAAGDARGRALARFTLLSVAGDLGAPALLALLSICGAGWRTGYAITAVLLAAWALALALSPIGAIAGEPRDADEPAPTLLAALRDAVRDRTLLAWLFATALCDLLDEILVVLASIHVRDDLAAGPLWQAATIGAFIAGDVIGLLALDRILRRWPERRVLAAAAAACIVAYVAWLVAPTPIACTLLALPLGLTVAPLYPLAAAQAYAQRPGASGVVLVASHIFAPFGIALPFVLGVVADHAGTQLALALLVIQPLGLLVLSSRRRDS